MRLGRNTRLAADNLLGMPPRTRLSGDGEDATCGGVQDEGQVTAAVEAQVEDGTVEPVAGTGGLTVVTAGAGVGTETGRGSVENLKHGGSVRATVSDTDLTGLSVDATVGSETASSGQIVPVAGAETETDASSVSVTAEISATDLEDESVTATQTFDSMTGTVFDG